MKTAFIKNILREIKSSLGRFVSIALMLLIGTFAYVGLKSAGPDMRNTLDTFTEETNMSHMMIQFTTGIEEKDKKKILDYDEISDSEFLNAIELKTSTDDKLLNLIELPKSISKPKVLEGRYPEKEGELLLDNGLKGEISIGDKILFNKEEDTLNFILKDSELDEIDESNTSKSSKTEIEKNKDNDKEPRLSTYEYEVVGFCITPEYLGEEDKGQSFSKYGDFYSFGYIAKDSFSKLKDKTEDSKAQIAYLRFKNLDNLKTTDLGFEKRSLRHKSYFEKEFKNRSNELFNEMNDNILDELAIKEDEIYEAKQELKKAEEEINKARINVLSGWLEYQKGKEEYYNEIEKAEKELVNIKKQLTEGEAEYKKGKTELDEAIIKYNSGLKQYNTSFLTYNQAKTQLENAEEQLNILKENKEKLQSLKSFVSNEISLKKVIDKYDSLVAIRTIKIKEKEDAISAGNIELANQIQIEIDDLNTQITALGDINTIKSQYNSLQTIKASFEEYIKGIYQLEYNAIFAGNQSYIQTLINSIPSSEESIVQGKRELSASKIILDNAKKDLDQAKIEIDNGEITLSKSKKELDNARKKLEDGENAFNKEKNKGYTELINSKKDLEEAERTIEENDTKLKTEKATGEKEMSEAEEKINKAKEIIKKIDKPLCIFSSRYNNANYYLFYNSSDKIDVLAKVFPPFAFLIALLVSLTTMTRMVDEQRKEIGTYKGLGYSNNSIAMKYAIYGGIAALIGGTIGIFVGANTLAKIVFNAYATSFVLKEIVQVANYSSGITAIILAISSTSIAAYLSVKKYLNKNAATLMRPRIQKKGKKTVFERVKFIWKRLPFLVKVTLRNVFRYKGKMFMTILGVGGCTGLLFFGFSLRNSMAEVLPKQTQEITKVDFIVSYNDVIDEDNTKKFKNFILTDDRINIRSEAHSELLQYRSTKGQLSRMFLIVPKDIDVFKSQINLIDSRTDNEKINAIPNNRKDLRELEKNRLKKLRKEGKEDIIDIDNKSAVFTEKFLDVTGKEKGEGIFVENIYGNQYKVNVGAPAKNYVAHFAYMSSEYYDKTFNKVAEPNTYLITLNNEADADKFKEELSKYNVITTIVDTRFKEIDKNVSTIDIIVIIVAAISGVLAFVVLYNLTYINLSERIREISTIKVLGFYPEEVIRYIYSETAILTALGIFAGYFIGNFLYSIIADIIIPDTLKLYAGNSFIIYAASSAITIVFFIIVGVIINKKLKKIDMVEALKGFE